MDMQGTRQLAVSQQQAWSALNNPDVLKACIPGCDRIDLGEDQQYLISMAVKIGPVSAKFSGKISLLDLNPPASYTLNFEGQGGVAGFGKGTAQVKLIPNDAGCELQYVVNAQVGGKIAQLGQRLIDGAAKSLSEDFFRKFDVETAKMFPADASPADQMAQVAAEESLVGEPSTPTWFSVRNAAIVMLGLVVVYLILK
jgi:carbon monoxide dehydrogenase subunit G